MQYLLQDKYQYTLDTIILNAYTCIKIMSSFRFFFHFISLHIGCGRIFNAWLLSLLHVPRVAVVLLSVGGHHDVWQQIDFVCWIYRWDTYGEDTICMFIRFNCVKWIFFFPKTFVKPYKLIEFLNTYTMCMKVWCGQGTRYNMLYM